ncbi:hypothetical protein [Paracoccus sp. SJTW-4]|uniref:hypothetical protein n=1 Tax=Paracoccus sp. SJTW-4 TaxID=3078428 RepID=UPI0039EBB239
MRAGGRARRGAERLAGRGGFAYLSSHLEAAGWRRGYAADCKDPQEPSRNNRLAENGYQGKPGSNREPDKCASSGNLNLKNEIFGALTAATDADANEARFLADAGRLIRAVLECAPENRLPLVEATYHELRAGVPDFAIRGDEWLWARRWAEIASRTERKAYCLATFNTLAPEDQARFLAHVRQEVAA